MVPIRARDRCSSRSASDTFGNMVFEKPDWDFRSINFDTDIKLAAAKTAQALDATDTNLGSVQGGGRKTDSGPWMVRRSAAAGRFNPIL